jgi:hypothetical protein
MPSIKANADKLQKAKEDGTVVPVSSGASASMSSAPPMPPGFPPSPSPYFSGPLPPVMSNAADQTRYFHNNAMPQARVAPNPPASQPTVGSVSESIVVNSGALVLLQTNNVNNPVQGKLNLISGTGISLVADQQGGVTISGNSASDLIDPDYVVIREDFVGVVAVNQALLYSDYPWITSNPNYTYYAWSTAFPSLGSVHFMNDGTASHNAIMSLGDAWQIYIGATAWPIFDYPTWKNVWVFQLGKGYDATTDEPWSWSQVTFYLGFGNYTNGGGGFSPTYAYPGRPMCFCGLRYDTDPTAPAISDTQFMFECVTNVLPDPTTARSSINVQGNTSATGISAVEGHIYRFEMEYSVSGQVTMTLTDGTAGTQYSATLAMPKWAITGSNSYVSGGTGGTTLTTIGFQNASNVTLADPFGPGSQMTIANVTNPTYIANNGTWTIVGANSDGTGGHSVCFLGGVFDPGYGVVINGDYSGFPAMVPWIAFGNDSQASPVENSKGVKLDFFGFFWTGSGTPNPLKARYW